MKRIAILGIGAMGSRMAARLLAAEREVIIWNRSKNATIELAQRGATVAHSPRDAAEHADIVLSMVRDDLASREVWLSADTGALHGLKPGSLAVEASTLTPGWMRTLGEAVMSRQCDFLEAPVSGSTPAAESGQLVFLMGGSEQAMDTAESAFDVLGHKFERIGPIGSATLAKLVTNTLLGVQVAALSEWIPALRKLGVDTEAVVKAVSNTPAWSPIASRIAQSMMSENFAPQFPVELILKDLTYITDVLTPIRRCPTVEAVRNVFLEASSAGLAGSNMTAVASM